MAAPSPVVKLLLRKARTEEFAASQGGQMFLDSVQTQLIETALAGGQKMISAATAGKSFSFADGWSTAALSDALDEALGIWASYDTDQLAALLDARPIRKTFARFGCFR